MIMYQKTWKTKLFRFGYPNLNYRVPKLKTNCFDLDQHNLQIELS